jgi:hypothetical protein
MTKTDRTALELATDMASRDAELAALTKSKLKGTRRSEGRGWAIPPAKWEEVAEAAAYHFQIERLELKPWEDPPCLGDEDGNGPADVLLRRMLAAGISRYHPDPLAALREAKRG